VGGVEGEATKNYLVSKPQAFIDRSALIAGLKGDFGGASRKKFGGEPSGNSGCCTLSGG
jgi:hypothetical protein